MWVVHPRIRLSTNTARYRVTKAGGVFGIITALIAYYIGVSEMLAAERRALVRLPLGVWQ
jgi:succinate-acetate transporter protein